MNLDYNSNKIYSDWVKESTLFFSKWKDSDFFSDKAEHIYFYSEVNDDSVNQLESLLKKSQKTNNTNNITSPPKPIVIHLNSPGGYTVSENLFNVMMTTQRVPICVIVESKCASAATTLALLAPYRLMIDYSAYLIHDMASFSFGKENEKISTQFSTVYQVRSNYLSLLKDRTNLSDDEIKTFITRDMFMSASYCLNKKLVDRVLKFPTIKNNSGYDTSKYSNLSLNLPTLLKKTNLNHLYIDTDILENDMSVSSSESSPTLSTANILPEICMALDKFVLGNRDIIKPILVHFKPSLYPKMSVPNVISLHYRLALIQKKTPIIALIEGPQSLAPLSLILMCPIRIMMTPSIILSTFSSSSSLGWGWKTIDILYNTKYIFSEVIRFFKQFSRLPPRFYKELQNKIINLKPEDSIKYELVHQVIHFRKITPLTQKNLIDYYDIDSLTSDYKDNSNSSKISKTSKSLKSKTSKSLKSKTSKSLMSKSI